MADAGASGWRRRPVVDVVGYLSADRLLLPNGVTVESPGGAALYAALGVISAGGDARLHAYRGRDFPQAIIAMLAKLGVRTEGVIDHPEPSRRSRLAYADSGRRDSPHYDDASWWRRTSQMLPPAPQEQADAVVFCPMPVTHLARLMASQGTHGARAVIDTSEAFASRERELLLAVAGKAALFAPSVAETRLLCPGRSDDEAIRDLLYHAPALVQKRGADGLVLARRGADPLRAPPLASQVVDPTGAGDAAAGAMAVALALGLSDRALLDLACAVSAKAVSGIGPSALGLQLPA